MKDIDAGKRIIKFRAWSKILKLMTYDIRISELITHNSKESDPKCIYINEIIVHYQKLFDLMQFIGHKDKYDREIYEGDIVKWKYPYSGEYHESDDIYGVIEWDDRDCQFKVRQLTEGFYEIGCGSREKLKFYDDGRNFEFKDLQVIGNIYKNPELLNIEEKIKEDKIKEEKMREEEKRKKGTEIRKMIKE